MFQKLCRRMSLSIFLLITLPVCLLHAQQQPARRQVDVARTTGGVVASDSAPASLVGRDVLVRGGNAVDAAVATAFAMAVTWPEAGNIGGGGFMMIAPPTGQVVCVDYRETAPAATNKLSFVNQTNRCDSRMVGVPGTVRGLALAHEKFGKLPWCELIQPAIDLARYGFVVDDSLAGSLNAVLGNPAIHGELYVELRRIYGRSDKRDWRVGDVLKLPELANTLERIACNGPDEFYTGQTAAMLANYMSSTNGFISRQDLANYKSLLRPATLVSFGGYDVYGPPLPSSAGVTIALALNMLEPYDFKPTGELAWNDKQIHIVAEAMKRAFRERAAYLGDADYVEIPSKLMSKDFARQLARSIDPDKATPSRELAGDIAITEGAYESPQTTHFSVIDQDGMAVANTYTLEASWGARVIAPGTGFVLNNEMGDFNWYPGYTNLAGKIGTLPNQIEPGKRMLSSMAPTIVKKNNKVELVTGSPGGRTIINTVLCILLQHLAMERPLPFAVDAPRFHHQWFPDEIRIESGSGESLEQLVHALQSRGHKVTTSNVQGSANSIAVDPQTGVRTGVSDWRRGGRVMVTR